MSDMTTPKAAESLEFLPTCSCQRLEKNEMVASLIGVQHLRDRIGQAMVGMVPEHV